MDSSYWKALSYDKNHFIEDYQSFLEYGGVGTAVRMLCMGRWKMEAGLINLSGNKYLVHVEWANPLSIVTRKVSYG